MSVRGTHHQIELRGPGPPGRLGHGRVAMLLHAAVAIGIAFLLLLLQGCDNELARSSYRPEYGPPPQGKLQEYVLAVHPLHNPERLYEAYSPVVEFLNAQIPEVHFVLEASRSYAEFEKKLYGRKFAFALPNPYQTLRSLERGYRVFAKVGADSEFRGIVLVRKDSGISKLADLRGRAISFPAPTALAATLLPQYYMHTHGLDLNRDVSVLYVGSQESSIMSVLMRRTAAGATWPQPWEHFKQKYPEQAAQLDVRWQTPPLVNNALVARDDVPAGLVAEVARLLCSLHESAEGRRILAGIPVTRIDPADASTYAAVKDFVVTFSRTVRPL